jgi:hypothetical protein
MTELPKLYGYYVVRDTVNIWKDPVIIFGTCAFEVMLNELEKGNVIVHIKLRDHD